jgi:hypothetical protein
MQEPPEGGSKTEGEAEQARPMGACCEGEPQKPSTPPSQRHRATQPFGDDGIPVRMYSELPPASLQAGQQSGRPSGLSGTFRRLAAGWSLSEAALPRPNGEGSDRVRHDAAQRCGGITSSGTFQRLDLQRLPPDGEGRCCEGNPGGDDANSIPCIEEVSSVVCSEPGQAEGE